LTAWRVFGLFATDLGLGPDEAQYWRWAQSLEWGYFSKPPLIAWLIAGATSMFGDAEWAIRLPAPFLHMVTALLVGVIGQRLFDVRTGALAAAYYGLMPGVTLGSAVMTTDTLLLPIWASGLLALIMLRDRCHDWRIGLWLGLSIGAGVLAKYAMIYFLIGLGIVALFDPRTRAALASRSGAIAGLMASTMVAPHILWNLSNDFQTIAHTADNAKWGGPLFHPEHALTFLSDQMAIVGPIGLVVLIGVLPGIASRLKQPMDKAEAALAWLAAFAFPAFLIVLGQAITSRAHANWAATAYVSGAIIIAAVLAKPNKVPVWAWVASAGLVAVGALAAPDMGLAGRATVGGSLATLILLIGAISRWQRPGIYTVGMVINAVGAVVFSIMAIAPLSWSEAMNLGDSLKRARAWPETVERLSEAVETHGAQILVVDEREVWHGIDYYGRDGFPVAVRSWRVGSGPRSFAEQRPIPEGDAGPVLIASVRPGHRSAMEADFEEWVFLEEIRLPIGGGAERRISVYLAHNFTPLDRTEAWAERFGK
ncbi:MAG: glycosyltransferase family 39 protein, partial [Pseudomonadota bacterium]